MTVKDSNAALTLTQIIGYLSDPPLSEQIHQLGHAGGVEVIRLNREDTLRRRLRAVTDTGTRCQIALPRDQRLADGAVLWLDLQRAIIVRMNEEHWLRFSTDNVADALQLGYFAGNLHWRVRFDGSVLAIALEGPEETYLERLQSFLADGRARRVNDD